MIDFVIKAVGLLAVLFVVFLAGIAAALTTLMNDAPKLYNEWRIIRSERRWKE